MGKQGKAAAELSTLSRRDGLSTLLRLSTLSWNLAAASSSELSATGATVGLWRGDAPPLERSDSTIDAAPTLRAAGDQRVVASGTSTYMLLPD